MALEVSPAPDGMNRCPFRSWAWSLCVPAPAGMNRPPYPDDADLDERALDPSPHRSGRPTGGRHRSASNLRPRNADAARLVAQLNREEARDPAALCANGDERGMKAEARTVLLRSIALGRRWLDGVL